MLTFVTATLPNCCCLCTSVSLQIYASSFFCSVATDQFILLLHWWLAGMRAQKVLISAMSMVFILYLIIQLFNSRVFVCQLFTGSPSMFQNISRCMYSSFEVGLEYHQSFGSAVVCRGLVVRLFILLRSSGCLLPGGAGLRLSFMAGSPVWGTGVSCTCCFVRRVFLRLLRRDGVRLGKLLFVRFLFLSVFFDCLGK